jgi:predicted amidohydrolase
MKITLAQLPVQRDIWQNYNGVLAVLREAVQGSWVVFPEGMLTGLFPDDPYWLAQYYDIKAMAEALNLVRQSEARKQYAILLGCVMPIRQPLFNTAVVMHPITRSFVYRKVNLDVAERRLFNAGGELRVYRAPDASIGVQMGREVLYPEQWRVLRRRGAGVIFHLNNTAAITAQRWRNLLISRALENQCYIVSVNTGAAGATLSSLVVNPAGEVVVETTAGKRQIESVTLDLSLAKSDHVRQMRNDVVELIPKDVATSDDRDWQTVPDEA